MSTELEQRIARLEEFAADVRGFTKILTELVRSHGETLDELRAEGANADARIAALADAQIRTEDALRSLGEQTDARVNALIDAVVRHTADGHGG